MSIFDQLAALLASIFAALFPQPTSTGPGILARPADDVSVAPVVPNVSGSGRYTPPWQFPPAARAYVLDLTGASRVSGIPVELLTRQIQAESGFNPRAQSPKGAIGIAQFMPATARDLGIDPLDASDAIYGAARYMRMLMDRFGTWEKALAAYNWGQGNVSRSPSPLSWPTETRTYVRSIISDVQEYLK